MAASIMLSTCLKGSLKFPRGTPRRVSMAFLWNMRKAAWWILQPGRGYVGGYPNKGCSRGPPISNSPSAAALYTTAVGSDTHEELQGAPGDDRPPSCCCYCWSCAVPDSLSDPPELLASGGPSRLLTSPRISAEAKNHSAAPRMLSGRAAQAVGPPAVDIMLLVSAAERAAARGCSSCPYFWGQTAAAAAAASFNFTWGFEFPLVGLPPPHIALPLVRPLLRTNIRLSTAIGALADELGASPSYNRSRTPAAYAFQSHADGCNEPGLLFKGSGDPTVHQSGPLVEMLQLSHRTLSALLAALRCALRGPSRHGGCLYTGLRGAPFSVRELVAVAGGFEDLRKGLLLLCDMRAAQGPETHCLEGPPKAPPAACEGRDSSKSLGGSGDENCKEDCLHTGASPCMPEWGLQLRGIYQEVVGAVLLLSLGDPQRPRLPPEALTGSLWEALNRVCWVGRGGAPTGLVKARSLLLGGRISLQGLLQLLAAFKGPTEGLMAGAFSEEKCLHGRPPIPHLGTPLALVHLLEKQIWESQGDWGAPVRAPIIRQTGCFGSSAEVQQQQEDAEEGVEVERLVFAASVLAGARAAGGPTKGPQGPFFLGLSLVSDALLQRREALLSTVPEFLMGPPRIAPTACVKDPNERPQKASTRYRVPDPLQNPPQQLFGEEVLAVLPGAHMGRPGAPTPAAVALLPLVLLRAFVAGKFSHSGLLSGICYGLIMPLGSAQAVQGLGRVELDGLGCNCSPPRKGSPATADEEGVPTKGGLNVSCLLDLWPSAGICELAGALRQLEAAAPPFFRFVFAHYSPPGSSWGAFQKSSKSDFPVSARQALRGPRGPKGAADGALDPLEIEEGRLSGALLESWESRYVGWMLHSPKRAPPPAPRWLGHLTAMVGTPRTESWMGTGTTSERRDSASTAATDAGESNEVPAENLEALALCLPYFPPLSALPAVWGPSVGWNFLEGSVKASTKGKPCWGSAPMSSGGLPRSQLDGLSVLALPSLLLGLLLHAPPPQQLQQGSVVKEESCCTNRGCGGGPVHWRALGALARALEATAAGLMSLWEHQFAPPNLRGGTLSAFFDVRSSHGNIPPKDVTARRATREPLIPPSVTGAGAARLCRQTLTASLSLCYLLRALPHRKPIGVCLPIHRFLGLLPLNSLRHLLVLLLLSTSPSLWGAAGGPQVQPIEAFLARLEQQRLLLQHEGQLLLSEEGQQSTAAQAEAAGSQQRQRLALLSHLEAALEGPQQFKFIGGSPSISQFQREVAAALEDLSDSLGVSHTGLLGTPRGFTLQKEVPVGPYFIDLLLAPPSEEASAGGL
ncbi:hypothetical protein cyc_02964 [Cyclospora cayetanensis]|uniref:Uncharacterized protein n=1 Tax=Cyclospora cayetanensis TaxID=88456 RepID=A0A1D3DAA6_9EIME|nr:hypothetical protein cyc_02964 [Cyclospora cayetanensis]